MIYINIETRTLRSPEYVGSDPVQRATWLSLLGYCCEQENGGRIVDARLWKDRRWQQTAGVTLEEVQDSCDLWWWNGDDLVLEFYPADKQAEVQAKRDGGRTGGSATTAAKADAARANGAKGGRPPETQAEPKLETQAGNPSLTQAEPKQKPNGREGKGRERKGSTPPTPSEEGDADAEILENFWDAYPQAGRARSSREKVRKAWRRLRNRPTTPELFSALQAWKNSDHWAEGFVKGAHLFLSDRMFESPPKPKRVVGVGFAGASRPQAEPEDGLERGPELAKLFSEIEA